MKNKVSKNRLHLVIQLLNEPMRDEHSIQYSFLSSFSIGLFIALFLYIFQPFGLSATGNELTSYVLAYGLITFILSLTFDVLIGQIFKKDLPTWTLGKWIVSTMILILLIATVNYLFTLYKLETFDFSISAFIRALYVTFIVGLFPVFFIGFFKLFQNKVENLKIAQSLKVPTTETIDTDLPEVNSFETLPKETNTIKTNTIKTNPIETDSKIDIKQEKPSINNEISKEAMEYNPQELLFVEAMQNYVLLYYSESNKETKRMTLSNLENQLAETSIIRCHRSFLVNKDKIVSVSGNAQGLKLRLEYSNKEIPVSRKYIPIFRQILT